MHGLADLAGLDVAHGIVDDACLDIDRRPQEPGFLSWSSGPSKVARGAISVWP